MGDTVFANGMSIVHSGSTGKTLAFPDVCLCPPSPPAGPVPTPLPNTASASDLAGGAKSVKIGGNPAGKKSSYFSRSTGDEAAQSTGGGVVTHVVQGKAYFQSYSMDVLIEGENVARHLDLMTHNHSSPPGNTPPAPHLAAMNLPPLPAKVAEQYWVACVREIVKVAERKIPVVARAQFVNLDTTKVQPATFHKEYGRRIRLRARVAATGDPAGRTVHFWADAGDKNDTTLAGNDRAGFDSAGSNVMKKTVQSGAGGWTPNVDFFVSTRGGDVFSVYASPHEKGEKGRAPTKAGPFRVWRRVFYEVTTMDPAPPPVPMPAPPPPQLKFGPPNGAIWRLYNSLRPVFIDLAPGDKKADTTAYRTNLSPTDRSTVIAAEEVKARAGETTCPFKTNIIFVDRAYGITPGGPTNTGVKPLAAGAGATVSTDYFFRPPGYADAAIILSAQYTPAAGPAAWAPLANPRIDRYTGPTPGDFVRILGDVPAYDPAKAYWYYFQYQTGFAAGGWGGPTGTLFICVGDDRRGNPAKPTPKAVAQILTHEIGHAFGLVPTTAPPTWRDPDPRDNGYSPRHCVHKHAAGPELGKPRCVMWYMLGDGTGRYDYCSSDAPDDCATFLRKADLSTLQWLK